MERYYTWSAGGTTLSISVAADVIIGLRRAATSAQGTSLELGGLLLGRRTSEHHISIEHFESVSSEHRRGVTFSLSGNDKNRLAQRLRARHHGLQTLGSFRTHLRQGLYMDQYDFELMSEYFAGPADVMLLIRPSDWQAGFFIWQEGDISRQKSYKEFPFDPSALLLEASKPLSAPVAPEPTLLPAGRRLPTLMRVGLVAASAGLAAVLAFYTHGVREHRFSPALVPSVSAAAKPSQFDTAPKVPAVYPPVDPDISSSPPDDPYEFHVKLPDSMKAGTTQSRVRIPATSPPSPPLPSAPPATTAYLPPPPDPVQVLQIASSLPSPDLAAVLTRPVLAPVHPTFVSEVSLEPTQPGVIRRGLHHVPVLNFFGKRSYKSGDEFSPASPLREVKPQLSDENPPRAAVDVRVWIDDKGDVTKSELITEHVQPDIADIASNAANKWKFKPARLSDRPVSSELVMHFRFVPKQNY